MFIMKDAKKLTEYVKRGSLHKVKRCLRKLKKEGDSFDDVKTGSGRTLLHLACYHGEDAIARVLLRAGSDADCVDKDGNAPIHLALNCVMEGNIQLMHDLVEPVLLKATSKDVLERQQNHQGITPALLLTRARNYVAEKQNKSSSSHSATTSYSNEAHDPDKEWNARLFSEWTSEDTQLNGDNYWSTFNGQNYCKEETYDDWAERMSFEYHNKQNYKKPHKRKAETSRKKLKENEKLLKDLQKEHEKYLQKQKRKAESKLKRKKEEYLISSNNFFNNNDDTHMLGYDDIPWPGHMSQVDEMLEVIQQGVEPGSLKKFILSQLMFWHPDKFQQKFCHRLNNDSERILNQVNELSQGLNKLMEDKNKTEI